MNADAVVNKALVERFWTTLYARDWERLATFFTSTSEYTDMCTPAEDLAVGPEQILKRLRLGLEPISGYEHQLKLMVAEGDAVITEHVETWQWHTGESVPLPFVTVMVLHDGAIARWSDYWDLGTLLNAAPAWWVDQIMVGWAE